MDDPQTCLNCPLSFAFAYMNYCCLTHKFVEAFVDTKHPDCPLIKIKSSDELAKELTEKYAKLLYEKGKAMRRESEAVLNKHFQTDSFQTIELEHIHCPKCGNPIYKSDFDEVPNEVVELLAPNVKVDEKHKLLNLDELNELM